MDKRIFLLPALLFSVYACRQKNPRQVAVTTSPDYRKAGNFMDRQNDSAFYYFNKVTNNSKDSLEIAKSFNQMSAIQSDAGDYFGSQESLSFSLKFLDEQNPRDRKCLASDYNELGMNSFNLKNYPASLNFYDQAIRFSDSPKFRAIILNNRANSYQKNGDYAKALALYGSIIAQIKPDEKEYARTLTNSAVTKWLRNPAYRAAPELLRALYLRQKVNDLSGQTASYNHLSDYYMHSNPDSALSYTHKLYLFAKRVNSPDDQLQALGKLVRLAPEKEARFYFSRYEQLRDSLQSARNAAKNQFALIRYQAEKIKGDNLKLQKDNAESRYQLIIKNTLFYSTLAFLFITSGWAVSWYRKRKQGMEREKEEAVRKSQLETSKKVHDVVANGLYRVMKEVQYQKLDQENLLDKIDHLYQQSRDISYSTPIVDAEFDEKLTELLQSFATSNTRVLLVGNSRDLWARTTPAVHLQIEQVLQEIMVNMSKHSQAHNVIIKFARDREQIRITYTDDGVGMPPNLRQGNGLISTGNRIRAIKGILTFEPNGISGLRVAISFPIA